MPEAVKIEKIVPEGKGLGYVGGKACFVLGALPGEVVRVRVTKDKPSFAEGAIVEIVESSKRRSEARETHFLSCSPWQGVDYVYQLELKRQMLEQAFGRLGVPVTDMVGAEAVTGYRNKLEFSLVRAGSGQMELAFHARGSLDELVAAPDGCVLGSAAMNVAAQALLGRVNALGLVGLAQTLTVRQADGQCVGVVALSRAVKRDWSELEGPELAGVVVSVLRGRNMHERLWSSGRTDLVQTVGGVRVGYPYDGFFQTNVAMFERALEQIVAAVPTGARVADLYGGAGTIGLAVAARGHAVVGVEVQRVAVELAEANARAAGLGSYRVVATPAERMDRRLLEGVDCVILDPPRAGLDRRVVTALLEAAPDRIIYLSCNPVTQARDVALLNEAYKTDGVMGFDLYPGTLHLESLVILQRRSSK